MKQKTSSLAPFRAAFLASLAVAVLILSGCTTPVAIDPATGQSQQAEYRAGSFYAPLDAPITEVFQTAIREMDAMGYFRTGELHRDDSIKIFARKIGDVPVTVRARTPKDAEFTAQSEIVIRVGRLGDLAESQTIYARIRDAL
jgi:hypothetical protein